MIRLTTLVAKFKPQIIKRFARNNAAVFQHRFYSMPVTSEPFLSGSNSNYLEEMYYAWLENPKSVHKVRLAVDILSK